MSADRVLMIGANSAIAKSLIEEFCQHYDYEITAVSRKDPPADFKSDKVQWLISNNSEKSISSCCNQLFALSANWRHIIICNGILHTEDLSPEKKLEELSQQNLETSFGVNTITPMLWLQHLLPLLATAHGKNSLQCCIAVLSARVGSIDDNHLGGWYSYRASKAALNMLLKTAAVEFARRAKGVKLIAFHPGTTDTPLSKPFQKRVKPENLFPPSFVANRLANIMQNSKPDGEASYLDWDNKSIAW